MQQQSSTPRRSDPPVKSDIINLGKLLKLILRRWYFFLIALIATGVGAYFYIEYSIPVYRVTSTILIEEEEGPGISGAENMLQGYGLRPGSQNLDNQIQVLTSWSMIRRTLEELSFEIDCYRKGLLKKVSYYPLDPIEVIPDPKERIPYNREFSVSLMSNNMFKLATRKGILTQIDTIASFGSKIDFKRGSFTILPDFGLLSLQNPTMKIYFTIHDKEFLTDHYMRRLNVVTSSKDGSVIRLSLEGTNKAKDLIFLDKLTRVFLASNLEKKNHEASRVIEFIDEQLVDVSDSLMITENRLQDFRSRNRIIDISAQAQQIIDQAVVLENEKARITLESNYFEYLSEYLSKEDNQEVPISPTTMGITDPLLERLMQELAGLQAEYFSGGVGDRNPLQTQLEYRILNTKQSIRETLQGIIGANKMAMDENNAQIKSMNRKASSLPVKERQLLGIERKFNLNNVLYTFLLQKRAEAQIQKASNKADNELIDPARVHLRPVSPNRAMIYLFAVLMGLGLPFIIILLADSLDTKITTEEDLKLVTNLPVTGFIPHSKLNYQTVVLNESQSQIAEAFRTFRARMQYFTRETESPVILVTSSVTNEGKSFISVNLASAYSLTGKRTVVVGFDLRRPSFSPDVELSNDKGVSTFLIGQYSLEDIIHSSGYENLDVIPAGPVPPNPAELIDSEKTIELFSELRKRYKYIIVDSSPIGTVSDSYPLANLSDATILLVRSGKSRKRPLEATISDITAIGANGLNILVNDLKMAKGAYSYKYKYR